MSITDLIFPLALVAIVAITTLAVYFQRKKQEELLQYQADKHNGYLELNNFLLPARLILPLGEQALNVYYIPGGKRRASKTVAELTGKLGPFPQISVSRNNLFQKALETFGKERFLIGDEEFDGMFVVSTTDENAARQILTTDVQKKLLEMASRNPSIDIDSQFFRFMVMRILKDTESYDLFIDTAFAIWKKLRQQSTERI